MDAAANLSTYLSAREPTARYASFDYCFNFFQDHRDGGRLGELVEGPNLQISCLHLGFYLASWGMLRGSAALLQRSVKHLVPVVNVVAQASDIIWDIDADSYSDESRAALLDTARQIKGAFPEGASDILVTKIMLGTFGCVPAFDNYFKTGLRRIGGVSSFGEIALQRIGQFYTDNADLIDDKTITTLDFDTGLPTERPYTRAKKIDMIFFVEGGL